MKKPLKYSLITLLTGTYIFDRIGYPSSIVGSSMEPALEGVTKRDSYFSIKDIVWINRLKVNPQKSDIIAIIAPYSRKETLVKRVSALEGDRVMFPKINDGNNFIVPDHFFCVKSDNDKVGFDSRNFGPISKSMIIGKVSNHDFTGIRRKRNIFRRTFNYFIDPAIDEGPILAALAYLQANTCKEFVRDPVLLPTTVLDFFPVTTECFSNIGIDFNNLPHTIDVAPSCNNQMHIVYEVLHAFGLFNEEVRPDRDNFVHILYQNIGQQNWAEFLRNTLEVVGPNANKYDYGSLMHNNLFFRSSNGQQTMILVYPFFRETVGQRRELSFNDLKLLNLDICNPCPTNFPRCYNGGYRYETNCQNCICPSFHGGQFCQRLKRSSPGCGRTVYNARSRRNTFTVRGVRNCYYKIRAGVGFLVEFTILRARLPGIEAKMFEDKSLTGARFCGNFRNRDLKSKANVLLLQYRGLSSNNMMRITFRRARD
uniref:Metalloendopeptidase n=1 Tax=Parastrongyloides trichosuri TaxID=131310 RepID=A0A0N4ZEF8_PARTI